MLAELLSNDFSLMRLIVGIVSALVVVFLTLPIHEWAHGFAATKLGDPTPRYQGRLTLNPFAHIDYVGALCIILFGVGWAKPVQINPRNFRNSKVGMAITAFAGPAMNIIVAIISMFLLCLTAFIYDEPVSLVLELLNRGYLPFIEWDLYGILIFFFFSIAQINVFLAVFNMIPIPPFDGSRILFAVLPDKYYWRVMQNERILMFVMLIIIVAGVLDGPLSAASDGVLEFISSIAGAPF